MFRNLIKSIAFLAFVAAPVSLARAEPAYEAACIAQGHPEWAFGDDATPFGVRPLFGCDDRPEYWLKRDKIYIDRLLELGYSAGDLGALIADQGWVWLKKNEPILAIRRFNLAFPFSPDNGHLYHGLALALAQAGAKDKLIGYWFDVASQQQNGNPERFADYGRFLIATGKFEKAVPVLERSRELLPEDTWTLMNLTQSYFATKRKPEACAAVKQLGASEPPKGYDPARFGNVVNHWEKQASKSGC